MWMGRWATLVANRHVDEVAGGEGREGRETGADGLGSGGRTTEVQTGLDTGADDRCGRQTGGPGRPPGLGFGGGGRDGRDERDRRSAGGVVRLPGLGTGRSFGRLGLEAFGLGVCLGRTHDRTRTVALDRASVPVDARAPADLEVAVGTTLQEGRGERRSLGGGRVGATGSGGVGRGGKGGLVGPILVLRSDPHETQDLDGPEVRGRGCPRDGLGDRPDDRGGGGGGGGGRSSRTTDDGAGGGRGGGLGGELRGAAGAGAAGAGANVDDHAVVVGLAGPCGLTAERDPERELALGAFAGVAQLVAAAAGGGPGVGPGRATEAHGAVGRHGRIVARNADDGDAGVGRRLGDHVGCEQNDEHESQDGEEVVGLLHGEHLQGCVGLGRLGGRCCLSRENAWLRL